MDDQLGRLRAGESLREAPQVVQAHLDQGAGQAFAGIEVVQFIVQFPPVAIDPVAQGFVALVDARQQGRPGTVEGGFGQIVEAGGELLDEGGDGRAHLRHAGRRRLHQEDHARHVHQRHGKALHDVAQLLLGAQAGVEGRVGELVVEVEQRTLGVAVVATLAVDPDHRVAVRGLDQAVVALPGSQPDHRAARHLGRLDAGQQALAQGLCHGQRLGIIAVAHRQGDHVALGEQRIHEGPERIEGGCLQRRDAFLQRPGLGDQQALQLGHGEVGGTVAQAVAIALQQLLAQA